MKLIFFLALIFFLNNCDLTKKNEKKTKLGLYGLVFYASKNNTSSNTCFIVSSSLTIKEDISTSIKSIDIYINNQYIMNSKVETGSIYYPSSSTDNYIIKFQENTSLSHIHIYSKNNRNCGVDFYKDGNRFRRMNLEFSLDLNSFTDLILGEYRFVAVR